EIYFVNTSVINNQSHHLFENDYQNEERLFPHGSAVITGTANGPWHAGCATVGCLQGPCGSTR
ncbi:MAG: hypothetical protein P1U37_04790, partial [Minwuia sp.]|nr:hypothetical protein [Minwuia sp.]